MHFGLKNVGSIYQSLVNMMFKDLIGKMMEVYFDDMLVFLEGKRPLRTFEGNFQRFGEVSDEAESESDKIHFCGLKRKVYRTHLVTK